MLTPDTIREVKSRGGVQAIAVSHPHFYTGVAAWAEAFDAPVFIHAKDRQWVTEPCSRITFWEGMFQCQSPGSTTEHRPALCHPQFLCSLLEKTVQSWPKTCLDPNLPVPLRVATHAWGV